MFSISKKCPKKISVWKPGIPGVLTVTRSGQFRLDVGSLRAGSQHPCAFRNGCLFLSESELLLEGEQGCTAHELIGTVPAL